MERIELITCPNPNCKLPLVRQIRNETVKRAEVIYRNKGIVGPLVFDFENNKLPIPVTCPKCHKKMLLEFVVGKLIGITFSFKNGCRERIAGKEIKEIAKPDNNRLRKIYLRLKTDRALDRCF